MDKKKEVKGKILKEVRYNHHYKGCTFYLENNMCNPYRFVSCIFDNCSFRSPFHITYSSSEFNNCNFVEGITFQCSGYNSNPITESILQIKNLSHIKISWCKVSHMPDRIFEFKNLISLMIKQSSLEEIDPRIYDMDRLRVLSLNFNLIKEIPDGVSKMKSLKHLHLVDNLLTEFPIELLDIDFYSLNIARNRITTLPSELDKMDSLRYCTFDCLSLEKKYKPVCDQLHEDALNRPRIEEEEKYA